MGAYDFGQYVDRTIREKGWPQGLVAVKIGTLPDGRYFNDKGIERIRTGGRRLDHMLVQRLIEVLDLDPVLAWSAAGLWPDDLDPEDYRRLRESGRPLMPALAQAVGGSGPPRQRSLRSARRAFSDQQGATTATLTVLAAWRRDSESARIGRVAA
jgi:hypothetical protein